MGGVARAAGAVPERQGQRRRAIQGHLDASRGLARAVRVGQGDLPLREGEIGSPQPAVVPNTAARSGLEHERKSASPACALRLQPEIKIADQLVVVELVGGTTF